jgi:endonuclease-8
VPEGDTIFRTARTLDRWLAGRVVTAVGGRGLGPHGESLVGATIVRVEARAKHLMIHLADGRVVHSHMRMSGSWHVYPAGERWRRPASQARLVIEAGDRHAVCFNAPVIELLGAHDLDGHPALRGLGPDVLVDPLDLVEIRRRARLLPSTTVIGDVLLDQQVVSGIGNIYRCEALFVAKLDPGAPIGAIVDPVLDHVVTIAADMLRSNVGRIGRDFGGGPDHPYVYGRTGRPCRRCRAPVVARRLGRHARRVYWCAGCQVMPLLESIDDVLTPPD